MGKTNYVILILGVIACIALSLIMQRVVRIKVDQNIPAVIGAITEAFGSRLDQDSKFEVREAKGGKIAELTLYPVLGVKPIRMVRSIGEFAWQEAGETPEFVALAVTVDEGFGRPRRFEVARPFTRLDPVRELKAGEEPRVLPLAKKQARSRPAAGVKSTVGTETEARARAKSRAKAESRPQVESRLTPPSLPPSQSFPPKTPR